MRRAPSSARPVMPVVIGDGCGVEHCPDVRLERQLVGKNCWTRN